MWQTLPKLGGKIDDLTVILNGISMYKKRKLKKNMGIFQHLTCSSGILRCDPFSFTGSLNA